MRDFREMPAVYKARSFTAFILAMSVGYTGLVSAQAARTGGGANAQLMQQFQQAVSERTQLQAENAKLKKELDDLKKQLGTAQQQATASKAGVDRSQAAVVAARAANDRTEKSLEDSKARMQELVGRFRETITTMRGIETERNQLQQQVAAGQSAYDKCAETNYALYQINSEVLDRYAHQGAFSYMARSEPFTRLKRTQIENLVLEYRQRADELRVKKEAAANTAQRPAAAPITTTTSPAPTPRPPTPKNQ
jgi:regulator of replication initiation timing